MTKTITINLTDAQYAAFKDVSMGGTVEMEALEAVKHWILLDQQSVFENVYLDEGTDHDREGVLAGGGWVNQTECRDCNQETDAAKRDDGKGDWPYYLKTDVWVELNDGWNVGCLCLPCAEKRHGEPFTADDFNGVHSPMLRHLYGENGERLPADLKAELVVEVSA